jgi:hypothetical protein
MFKTSVSTTIPMKITRKTALSSIFGSLLAVPSFGKKTKSKDLEEFKTEFLQAWARSEEYTLKLFNQVKPELLDYKYTPESFSFRTQFVHCIVFNSLQLCGRLNVPNPYKDKNNSHWSALSKEQLAEELKGFYQFVGTLVKNADDKTLMKEQGFSGGPIPMWRLFYAMENHIIHHRGQALCYLRLNGVTPEGFVGW